MRLSWNEIRARAAGFAAEFADATYEKGETQTFYNAFFQIFGVKRRSVAVYERRVDKLSGNTGFIDLFWPQVLLIEQKSAGRDLSAARVQAEDYFLALKEHERPRYILACDFQTFDLYDLSERTRHSFPLAELPEHVERFGFIMGVQKVAFRDQDPVNIKAAELIGALHDKLEEAGFTGTDLERFLVRIVFCLFADDTGVFQPRNMFLDWLEQRTAEDGHDLGSKLAELFQTLDTPEDRRGALLDEDLAAFPYINGDLFRGATRIPAFNSEMREALLTASRFDWSPISPAIFGSLFQSVMNKEERRKAGAHYTTEKNILKVINPLFMDGLRAEFQRARSLTRGRRDALDALHTKLGILNFLDPACGCGNFLIIAYRELRRLEIELLQELIQGRQLELDAAVLSKVDVDQFHGIEIGEFPAEIARAAMWMMDHILNNELSRAFGQNYARIPLKKSANIVHGDALEIDWADVIAPERCDFILGNPPFVGHHLQSETQKALMRKTYGTFGDSAGVMDFVTAWFLKAGKYIQGTRIECAFVATNSISQGEQVGILWRAMAQFGLFINFAHRTFKWESEARGKAAVYCVIASFSKISRDSKSIFDYAQADAEPQEIAASQINAYLVDAPWVLIGNESKNLFGMPEMQYGSKPTDGGHFLLTNREKIEFLDAEPEAAPFIRPFISAREYLHGEKRWVIWLVDAPPEAISKLPKIRERIAAVAAFRKASKAASTRDYAYPTLFRQVTQPSSDYILVPRHSSERRDYVPFGFFPMSSIVADSCLALPDAGLHHFSVIQSSMHMAWMKTVCGRLKGDIRYSKDIVYNNFPWPELDDKAKAALAATGQAILDARAAHPGATLADLYDPDAMPPDLRRAHRANDAAVDRLYRKKPFESERERVEFLFALYEALRAPLMAKKGKK